MIIKPELDVDHDTHIQIQKLRNQSFPDHAVPRSYFKQLPHYRVLLYREHRLIATMGLDYRVMAVAKNALKILGIIDLCVAEDCRGQGIAGQILTHVSAYAAERDVDFLLLMADHPEYYEKNGFKRVECVGEWLKVHEHQHYGIAQELLGDLMIKPISGKPWLEGELDWLGYMY